MRTTYTHSCIRCNKPAFNYVTDVHTLSDWYTWACEHCGCFVNLTFINNGKTSHQTPTKSYAHKALKLCNFIDTSIYFISERLYTEQKGYTEPTYWEDTTCPTNVLNCEEFYSNTTPDPHGIIKVLKQVRITTTAEEGPAPVKSAVMDYLYDYLEYIENSSTLTEPRNPFAHLDNI